MLRCGSWLPSHPAGAARRFVAARAAHGVGNGFRTRRQSRRLHHSAECARAARAFARLRCARVQLRRHGRGFEHFARLKPPPTQATNRRAGREFRVRGFATANGLKHRLCFIPAQLGHTSSRPARCIGAVSATPLAYFDRKGRRSSRAWHAMRAARSVVGCGLGRFSAGGTRFQHRCTPGFDGRRRWRRRAAACLAVAMRAAVSPETVGTGGVGLTNFAPQYAMASASGMPAPLLRGECLQQRSVGQGARLALLRPESPARRFPKHRLGVRGARLRLTLQVMYWLLVLGYWLVARLLTFQRNVDFLQASVGHAFIRRSADARPAFAASSGLSRDRTNF